MDDQTPRDTAERLARSEAPASSPTPEAFGSDFVADTLRELDIPYVALVPGSSFRGLHDSIINHLGNSTPQMLVCLHEEASVGIAHGYAKVTGKAMAAALHSNVGLQHASMAIFNAWCDRMPILLLGATGPLDAMQRRPWIEWIHTSRDQASMIRHYIKWDDTPHSPAAARDSLIRAKWIAETNPHGPTYVNLDVGIQEQKLGERPKAKPIERLSPPVDVSAGDEGLARAAEWLKGAKTPLVLAGHVSRSIEDWENRVRLVESLGAKVITDIKLGAAFPTDHPLHVGAPGLRLDADAKAALREADVILSLDWVDLGGTLDTVFDGEAPTGKVIQVSRDHVIHNGWSMDHQVLSVADLFLSADPDAAAARLNVLLDLPHEKTALGERAAPAGKDGGAEEEWSIRDLAVSLREAVGEREFSFVSLPLSWHGGFWPFRHPLEFVGLNGGAGVGGGPSISVGAALALKDSGRLPIAICGDGDFVMGHTALWTAVHYGIPMLVVVANNRCYFNDVKHQEHMAVSRGRAVENKWIGQMLNEPDIDVAALGTAQGARGFGPMRAGDDLAATFKDAIAHVEAGGVAVVDVRIRPGYAA